jgi:hypothetical protein
MTPIITKSDANRMSQPGRKRWEAPAIVLERSLEVSAQDGGPQGVPNGFIAPLSASASTTGTGNCL